MIYLDNAATTATHPGVVREMCPYLNEEYGNPSSLHSVGRAACVAIEEARGHVADFLHTSPEHIIFTSGGSEGNNFVLRGLMDYLLQKQKTVVVTSPIEHPSVLRVMDYLAAHGFQIRYLPIDTTTGSVDAKELKNYISEEVGLVSVMYVNNETGAINPVKDIAELCRQVGALFHTDCVQAVAAFDVNIEEIGADFATMSAHKIHGPKGVGAVYIRDVDSFGRIIPLVIGGEDQERGLRGGTENVAGIVGFGKACCVFEPPKAFSKVFLHELGRCMQSYDPALFYSIYINGSGGVGNILNIEVAGVNAETLVLMMDAHGVCISAGSACHSNNSEPSHVLKAMGLSDDEARSSVRISTSSYQTEVEILNAAKIMADCIVQLLQLGGKKE